MASLKPVSPLASLSKMARVPLQGRTICIEEVRDYGLIRLQVFSRGSVPGRGSESTESLSILLGEALPDACQLLPFAKGYAFWTAPGEWIIAVPAGSEIPQSAQCDECLTDVLHAVTIMTDSRLVLRISGAEARQLLAKCSAVDFHPSVFGLGRCVITKFARLPVMITQPTKAEDFMIFVDRSQASYLWEWLEDAAGEFEATTVNRRMLNQ